jgi:hypothetical protein
MFRLIARAMMHSIILASLCSVILLGHSRTGYALPTLNTCSSTIDTSVIDFFPSDWPSYHLIYTDGSCVLGTSFAGDAQSTTVNRPIVIFNNMLNDGTPAWLNNVEFQFDSSITEITINGTTASARYEFEVTSDTNFTIEYKYTDDKYYRFVTTATPDDFTMSSFTIEAYVPNTDPVISSNGGNSTAAIDVAENQTTVTDVQTTDDNDSEGAGLTYTITGGADQALFDIVAGTGILTFKTAPDKETPSDVGTDNIYDVQVTVTDSSSLTDVQDIAVTVTDVTEGPTAEETQKVVSTFMTNRANHVLSHQPDILGFLDGTNLNGGGPLGNLGFSTSRSRILAAQNQVDAQNLNQNTASSDDNIQLALASANEEPAQTGYGYSNAAESRTGTYDVWTELYGSKTNAGTSDSSYWVGYVGGHYFINEQTLVGVVGQYDWSKESDASVSSNANGQGWMIGPYLAGQLPDQKLYYEARASWGQSTNKVSPDGTYTDGFDTTRWLVSAKVSGSYAINHLIVKPAISVSYYEETQHSYTDTDTNANLIAAQTISIGELKFGPTLTDNIELDNGLLFQPSFGINGVYNFAIKDNVASQGAALCNNDLRARIDAGFNLVDQDKGRSISTSGFYDGIGINDYQSYDGKVRLTLSFN